MAVIPVEDRPGPRLGNRKTPLWHWCMGAEGTTTRTTSTDGSRPLTERDSDSLEPGGGCVDRSGTTSLRPSDTQVTVNFSPFLLSPLFLFLFRWRFVHRVSLFLFLFSFKNRYICMQRYWINKKKNVRMISFVPSFEFFKFHFQEVLILDATFLSFDSLDFLVFFLLISKVFPKLDGDLIGIKFDSDHLDGIFRSNDTTIRSVSRYDLGVECIDGFSLRILLVRFC